MSYLRDILVAEKALRRTQAECEFQDWLEKDKVSRQQRNKAVQEWQLKVRRDRQVRQKQAARQFNTWKVSKDKKE